ncbi:tubulin binding cofactor A-domain-containing protein [Pavlovales sp. CCMP2436]|nr:tubulin binding cofactor A-domain-containing protein [Pavlovales sp. CCMP2436]
MVLKSRRTKAESGTTQEIRDLKVKAGVIKRILSDLAVCDTEISKQAAKVEAMKAEGADSYDIKKQEEVLTEFSSSRPADEDRLAKAVEDLEKTVEEVRESPDFDDLKETEEFKAAAALLDEQLAAAAQ